MNLMWRDQSAHNKALSTDPDVLGGSTVFSGTRVPVTALFDYLSTGVTVKHFLDEFPTVTTEQVQACLDQSSTQFKGNDEAAA